MFTFCNQTVTTVLNLHCEENWLITDLGKIFNSQLSNAYCLLYNNSIFILLVKICEHSTQLAPYFSLFYPQPTGIGRAVRLTRHVLDGVSNYSCRHTRTAVPPTWEVQLLTWSVTTMPGCMMAVSVAALIGTPVLMCHKLNHSVILIHWRYLTHSLQITIIFASDFNFTIYFDSGWYIMCNW